MANTTFSFEDKRLSELLFRYRARNFSESLSDEEQEQWGEFRYQRLTEKLSNESLTLDEFHQQISKHLAQSDLNDRDREILEQLSDWGEHIL